MFNSAIPTLETEQLTLRGWQESDFDRYAEMRADEETSRYISGLMTRDDAWRNMATIVGHWVLRGFGFWAIEDRKTSLFIGWAGLWNPEGWPEPEVGYGLHKDFRGKGLMTEAASRARTYAYETLGWQTLVSCIALENLASIRVAERLGARLESETNLRGHKVGIFRHPAATEIINPQVIS